MTGSGSGGRLLGIDPLEQGRLRRRKRMEGGIWMYEWMSGRWDVTLSFFFMVSVGCAILGSTTEGKKRKDIYNGLLKV